MQFFSLPGAYPGLSNDSLFGYSGATLASWDPAQTIYETSSIVVSRGKGYWARFPQPVMISAIGTPTSAATNFNIPLSVGWNAVGDPFPVGFPASSLTFTSPSSSSPITFAQAAVGNPPLISPAIWSYSPATNKYVAASTINPDQGYWVYASQPITMVVPHP